MVQEWLNLRCGWSATALCHHCFAEKETFFQSPSVLEQQPRRSLESFRQQCAAHANQCSFLPGYPVINPAHTPFWKSHFGWKSIRMGLLCVWGELRLYLGPSRICPNHVTLVLPSQHQPRGAHLCLWRLF